jgi:RNA polymerase sigma-70 factor (ECF subfamily)
MKRSPDEIILAAYDEHADALFRFCYAFTGRRDDAKDAVQETFVRTWTYLSSGRRVERIKAFLYRTARNMLIDRSRKAREHSLEGLQEAGWDVPDERTPDPLMSAQAAEAVRLAAQLEPAQRDVLLMRYLDGMPPREIAEVIGDNENAISVRIHRALQKIRTLMGTRT